MKKNDLAEVKNLDTKTIEARIKSAKGEVSNLIIDRNMNKLKDLKVIAKKRRDIAQMSTVLTQKLAIAKLEENLKVMKGETK